MANKDKLLYFITDTVTAVTGCSGVAIRGRCRLEDIRDARNIVALVAKEHRFSLPEIGKYLGRHHTTILNMVRRAKDLISADIDFKCSYITVKFIIDKEFGNALPTSN